MPSSQLYQFQQPKGAVSDAKEIEYVALLLGQTSTATATATSSRADDDEPPNSTPALSSSSSSSSSRTQQQQPPLTVTAGDVARYLVSRHGIQVTTQYVLDNIFCNGLCARKRGGTSEDHQVHVHDGEGEGEGQGQRSESESKSESKSKSEDLLFLDAPEMVAALFIPELIRYFQLCSPPDEQQAEEAEELEEEEERQSPDDVGATPPAMPQDVVTKVLDVLVQAAATAATTEQTMTKPNPILDADLVRNMLLKFGEPQLAEDDELIQNMVRQAKGGGGGVDDDDDDDDGGGDSSALYYFDAEALMRALVGDVVQHYDAEADHLASNNTTNYYDVFRADRSTGLLLGGCCCCCTSDRTTNVIPTTTTTTGGGDDDSGHDSSSGGNNNVGTQEMPSPSATGGNGDGVEERQMQEKYRNGDEEKAKSVFTFPSIDFMADTFRSSTMAVCLWLFFLSHLLASGTLNITDIPQLVPTQIKACEDVDDKLLLVLCNSFQIFLTWVNTVFTSMVVGGIVIVGVGSLGNSIVQASPVVAALTVVSLAPMTYFIVKAFTFGTSPSDFGDEIHLAYALSMTFVVAGIFYVVWLRDFLYAFVIPREFFALQTKGRALLGRIFAGGQMRNEASTKRAATYKVNRMIRNAYELSFSGHQALLAGATPMALAIWGYVQEERKSEEKGGWWWTWKSSWNRDLYEKEGVRVSMRLMAGNAIQAIIILYVILYTVVLTDRLVESYSTLPGTLADSIAGGVVEMFVGGLTSQLNSNSSLAIQVADGAIDLVYNGILPALYNLTKGSCDELSSMINSSQAEAICTIESAYSARDLLNSCQLYSLGLDGLFDIENNTIGDWAMACSGTDALGNSTEMIDAVCTGNAYAACNNSTESGGNFTGLPSAEAMKSLVRVSLQQTSERIISFLNGLYESTIVYFNDYIINNATIQPWQIQMAFGISGLLAFIAAIILAASYYPSTVTTTLKFRSGVIPSLQDPNFTKYRQNVHYVTLIMGGMFWGTLIYLAAIIFTVGVIILVITYFIQRAYYAGQGYIAGWIIGTVVAYVVQFCFFMIYGTCSFNSFFRNRPATANIWSLLWETAWLGLSVFAVVMRLVKLIVVATLEVGRFDKPFFAEGVGTMFGLLQLDGYPYFFRKDILSHEAHLHPYIERLGKMYLMKIRYGEEFATTAGTVWRLLFVEALMPWIRTHRVPSCSSRIVGNGSGNNDVEEDRRKSGKIVELSPSLSSRESLSKSDVERDCLVKEKENAQGVETEFVSRDE